MVLKVDKEKGFIDLSKRRVCEDDVAGCEERYNKNKLVHSVMRHVADTMDANFEAHPQDLYTHVAWPLYRKYGHAYEVLPYDLLMQQLDISNVRELEDLLINACMYSGIVRGKLDQRRRFEVQFAAEQDLRPGQLDNRIATLANWYVSRLFLHPVLVGLMLKMGFLLFNPFFKLYSRKCSQKL